MSIKRIIQSAGVGSIVVACLVIVGSAHTVQAQEGGWQQTLQDGQANQLMSHRDGNITAMGCDNDDATIAAQTFDGDGNVLGEIPGSAADEERIYFCDDTQTVDQDGMVYGVRDREVFGRAHPTFTIEAYQDSEQLWEHTFQYDKECHISDPQANWFDVGPNGLLYVFFTRGYDKCDESAPDYWVAALDPADGHTVFVREIDRTSKFGVYQDGLVGIQYSYDSALLQFYDFDGNPKGDPVSTPLIDGSFGADLAEEFGVNLEGTVHMLWNIPYYSSDICGHEYNYAAIPIVSESDSIRQDWWDCSVTNPADKASSGPWGGAVTRTVNRYSSEASIRTHDRQGRELSAITLPLPEDVAPLPGVFTYHTQLLGDVNGNAVFMSEYGRERNDGEVVPEAKIFAVNPYTGIVVSQFDTADLDHDLSIGFKIHDIALSDGRIYMLGDQCLAHPEEAGHCTQTLETQLHALPMEPVGVDYPRGGILDFDS